MHLRAIIGQLFILGFQGSSITSDSCIVENITQRNLGGVILFDRFITGKTSTNNIHSPNQLKSLCQDLQSLSENTLIISVDQEGGKVRRLKEKHGFPFLPSAYEMARAETSTDSLEHAIKTGKLLAETGINCNFAPVTDLNINPSNPIIGKLDRSFSAYPHEVTEHCEAWLDGLQQSGILGCLKHFPGHGSSRVDSHKGFVDISESWKDTELIPYKKLFNRKKVHAVMMGHLFHQGFDSQYPASLSPNVIQNLLRQNLNYQGLVISDDLQMRAITERYGLLEAIVLALAAGVDLVIIGNNLEYDPHILKKAINHVEKAVKTGKISEQALYTSYERIQNIKDTLI